MGPSTGMWEGFRSSDGSHRATTISDRSTRLFDHPAHSLENDDRTRSMNMAIRLGDIAPDFTAETTEGTINFHD